MSAMAAHHHTPLSAQRRYAWVASLAMASAVVAAVAIVTATIGWILYPIGDVQSAAMLPALALALIPASFWLERRFPRWAHPVVTAGRSVRVLSILAILLAPHLIVTALAV